MHEAERIVLLSEVTLAWLILFGGDYLGAFFFKLALPSENNPKFMDDP